MIRVPFTPLLAGFNEAGDRVSLLSGGIADVVLLPAGWVLVRTGVIGARHKRASFELDAHFTKIWRYVHGENYGVPVQGFADPIIERLEYYP